LPTEDRLYEGDFFDTAAASTGSTSETLQVLAYLVFFGYEAPQRQTQ